MAVSDIKTQALQAREAAVAMARLPTAAKDALLQAMAQALEEDAGAILAANARDLEAAAAKGVGSAMLDRLRLDPKRLRGVADALREVAALPDPVGQVTRAYDRPNGIRVERGGIRHPALGEGGQERGEVAPVRRDRVR